MDPSKEARVSLLLERLKVDCQLKGIQVISAADARLLRWQADHTGTHCVLSSDMLFLLN